MPRLIRHVFRLLKTWSTGALMLINFRDSSELTGRQTTLIVAFSNDTGSVPVGINVIEIHIIRFKAQIAGCNQRACRPAQAGDTKVHANMQAAPTPIAVWPHSSRPQSRMSSRIIEAGAFRRMPYNKSVTGIITK
jgi:hypothetical protein